MPRPILLCVLFSVLSATSALAQDENNGNGFLVEVDKARVMRLPRAASAVIIGNPSIADATVHDGRLLLITGKTFGGTNLIALDARGNVIIEQNLNVIAPKMAAITYYRGGSQRSYSCAQNCELAPSVGDDSDVFDTLIGQQKDKSDQGTAAASSE